MSCCWCALRAGMAVSGFGALEQSWATAHSMCHAAAETYEASHIKREAEARTGSARTGSGMQCNAGLRPEAITTDAWASQAP